MGCGEAVIVAGIGCRKGCPADAIVALVREAGGADMLAAAEWKRGEAGLLEAARTLGLPVVFVGRADLSAVQAQCLTHSATAVRAVGLASIAEAAALAGGGTLLRPRFGQGWATCATALAPFPPPLEGGAGGGVAAARVRDDGPAPTHPPARGTPPPGPLPQGEGEQTV